MEVPNTVAWVDRAQLIYSVRDERPDQDLALKIMTEITSDYSWWDQ